MELFKFDLWSRPLKTWGKAKKYFKKPKLKIHFSTLHNNCPFARYDYVAKIFHVKSCDVGWKTKYDSVRHESDPYIWICLFHKWVISFNYIIEYKDEIGNIQDGGMYYWEYLLNYLYYDRKLSEVECWTYKSKLNSNYTVIVPTILFSLNKRGLKEFQRLFSEAEESVEK